MDNAHKRGSVRRIEPAYLGLNKLFYAARDAVIVGEPATGQILLWNAAAEKIFGYTEEEALGRLIEDLVPDALKAQHRAGLSRFAETGHGPLVDSGNVVLLPAVRKDGTEIKVELTLTPVESDRLPGHFAMAIIRDVTERTQATEDLAQTNANLVTINDAMRDFVSIASHDLRSPITSILGFASTLKARLSARDEDQEAEFAAIIERQARHLSRIVQDLLTLTRIESGGLDPVVERISVQEAVDQATEFYSQEADFDTDIPDGLAVMADTDHLRRILANYVGNATRYGEPPIIIKAVDLGETVEIAVSDHGEGVPEDFEKRLFTKFARADTPATHKAKGTGLGLSIVKGLAEANNGLAWYRREPDLVSFGVTLPKAK